ncbi:phage tail tip lysozyme [Brucella pseudintermedia]|uniref:phage tail tip lysozyme n=1 Tax=Brucella pseudintermedia TaxID=370111 RepID=UPI003671C389|nr:phage tail tip lysozyme [Brucella pseudintermedia]
MATNTGVWLAQQLMQDFGLSPAAAAGFAGNLAHESGNFQQMQEISPLVKGSRGGFGWAQWTGPRRRQFESWSEQNGLDPSSKEANYGFLKYELTNTPEGGVLKSLQGVDDPSQAAQIVSDKFLRPGIPHMESRIQRSNQIASSLGSRVAAQPASPPQASGTPAPAMGEPMTIGAPGGIMGAFSPGAMASQQAQPSMGQAIAALGSGDIAGGLGGIFGAMAAPRQSSPSPQAQPMPQMPIQGPTPQQAAALSNFLTNLTRRRTV